MDRNSTLIVIPTYNEADNILPLIEAIQKSAPAVDILVVDDNSPDGTGNLAAQLSLKLPEVATIRRAKKAGLASAYVDGFKYALEKGYTWIGQMDADFSHRPEELPLLLAATADTDVVIGSRYCTGGGTKKWPIHRMALSRAANLYVQKMLGLPYKDLTSGFTLYHQKVLERIDLDLIQSVGYCFQSELKWRAHRSGFQITEIPISYANRKGGKSKISLPILWEATTRPLQFWAESWA